MMVVVIEEVGHGLLGRDGQSGRSRRDLVGRGRGRGLRGGGGPPPTSPAGRGRGSGRGRGRGRGRDGDNSGRGRGTRGSGRGRGLGRDNSDRGSRRSFNDNNDTDNEWLATQQQQQHVLSGVPFADDHDNDTNGDGEDEYEQFLKS